MVAWRALLSRTQEAFLATREEISDFLAKVDRRAFKQAVFAVRDRDTALDVVQDAMEKLVAKYHDRPAAELPLLFQRILQNVIRDHFRRQRVRSLWTTLLSALGAGGGDGDEDPMETLLTDAQPRDGPHDELVRRRILAMIEEGLYRLPARQREAFLLRYLEELDTAETAKAMGCSAGSVKTHCSRATHALAAWLRAKGVEP